MFPSEGCSSDVRWTHSCFFDPGSDSPSDRSSLHRALVAPNHHLPSPLGASHPRRRLRYRFLDCLSNPDRKRPRVLPRHQSLRCWRYLLSQHCSSGARLPLCSHSPLFSHLALVSGQEEGRPAINSVCGLIPWCHPRPCSGGFNRAGVRRESPLHSGGVRSRLDHSTTNCGISQNAGRQAFRSRPVLPRRQKDWRQW